MWTMLELGSGTTPTKEARAAGDQRPAQGRLHGAAREDAAGAVAQPPEAPPATGRRPTAVRAHEDATNMHDFEANLKQRGTTPRSR